MQFSKNTLQHQELACVCAVLKSLTLPLLLPLASPLGELRTHLGIGWSYWAVLVANKWHQSRGWAHGGGDGRPGARARLLCGLPRGDIRGEEDVP
jgi:hypothetical protein